MQLGYNFSDVHEEVEQSCALDSSAFHVVELDKSADSHTVQPRAIRARVDVVAYGECVDEHLRVGVGWTREGGLVVRIGHVWE